MDVKAAVTLLAARSLGGCAVFRVLGHIPMVPDFKMERSAMAAGACGDYGPLPYLHLSAEKRNARLPPDRAFRLSGAGKTEV